MCQVRQHCRSRKDKVKVRANKVTVDTWAIRCTVNRVRISVEAQEVWAADTTNREDRIIKRVATELTVPGMARDSMGTTIAAGGGPTMGTRFGDLNAYLDCYSPTKFPFSWTCTLLSQKWYESR